MAGLGMRKAAVAGRLRLLIFVAAVAFGGQAVALGQTSFKAREAGVLVERDHPFTLDLSATEGKASVVQEEVDGKTVYRLRYVAPETIDAREDKVTYVDGGKPQTIKLTITPTPLGFGSDAAVYNTGFKALFIVFILAVLLESGLAVVFSWRPFVEFFNARAVKPLISFAVALIFVRSFGLDVVTALVNAFSTQKWDPEYTGSILSALVIAGGSAGVNNIMVAFGYRQQRTPESVAAKPPPDKAWIAVKVVRQQIIGPVEVYIGPPQDPPAAHAPVELADQIIPLVGIVKGEGPTLLHAFLADRSRFPSYGGHAVDKDTTVAVRLIGHDAAGIVRTLDWGPRKVAAGAVIDLELKF